MKMNVVECPGCGAKMDIDLGNRQASCSYCGTRIILGDDIIRRHAAEEAKLKEAELRLKELEYRHERELRQEQERQAWRRIFWISVAVYVAILVITFVMADADVLFGIIFIFGGIALLALHVSLKRGFPEPEAIERSSKDWLTTLLLCIFLGGLGVHRFYTGSVGLGIVYLLTFGLFGVGWIVDVIRIICGTFKDGNGRYVRNN